jgi:transposase
MRHAAMYEETDERFTTQTCSACGAHGGSKGIADLGIKAVGVQ